VRESVDDPLPEISQAEDQDAVVVALRHTECIVPTHLRASVLQEPAAGTDTSPYG
jgi:hypothetical protein